MKTAAPKVSIITACYNGEKYIERWKNSILNQTYNNIEVLVTNDGSIDKSQEMLSSIENEFLSRGYEYHFYSQPNLGVSAAVNVGLRHMNGEYFMNYDIDDILEPWCIADRVYFLEHNSDCGMVLSNGWYVTDDDIEKKYPLDKRSSIWKNLESQQEKEYVFKKRFLGKQGAGSLTYMFRSKNYLEINPKRELPPVPYAQDDMLLLLNAFAGKCGYINNPSFRYVDCKGSLSKDEINPSTCVKRLFETREAIHRTIDILPMSEVKKEKYKIITNRFINSELQWHGYIEHNESILPREVAVFGAGKFGKKVMKIIETCGIVVNYIIDNDSSQWGGSIDDTPIVNLGKVEKQLEEKVIVIAVLHDEDIKKQLKAIGLEEEVDFYSYKKFMNFCRHELMKKMILLDSLSVR